MNELSIIPLGGMGNVTGNMFVYEYGDELMLFDCGIGFPEASMPGVDILIPDINYLHKALEKGKKIVGMVFTHGHDDHIAAAPYVLPELPDFPLYASALTAGFAEKRLKDGKVQKSVEVVQDGVPIQIGENFTIESLAVTHSVPDTKHYIITTPSGKIYHGTDFKLDKDPVDNVLPDYDRMEKLAQEDVLCVLIDCLRVENREWVPSESTVGPAIEAAILGTKGKAIVTLMSSHIHRIQQTVDAAVKCGRKIAFIGRSVEQNVQVALDLGKLHIPQGILVDKRDIADHPDSSLCIVIAGSQGQEGSSLVRAVYGDHPVIQIKKRDKVLFSADAIPGNLVPYYKAIDELARNGVEVVYPDVEPNLHQSGHASALEQQKVINLVKPRFLMPIGGADRHRAKFREFVAREVGYSDDQVLTPASGEILSFPQGVPTISGHISLHPRVVDGLGIGDVGPKVLSDRRALSQAGMVVLVVPRRQGRFDYSNMQVVSRGFVFMQQADEVVSFIKEEAVASIKSGGSSGKSNDAKLRRSVEQRLRRALYKAIKREPMITVVFMDC